MSVVRPPDDPDDVEEEVEAEALQQELRTAAFNRFNIGDVVRVHYIEDDPYEGTVIDKAGDTLYVQSGKDACFGQCLIVNPLHAVHFDRIAQREVVHPPTDPKDWTGWDRWREAVLDKYGDNTSLCNEQESRAMDLYCDTTEGEQDEIRQYCGKRNGDYWCAEMRGHPDGFDLSGYELYARRIDLAGHLWTKGDRPLILLKALAATGEAFTPITPGELAAMVTDGKRALPSASAMEITL